MTKQQNRLIRLRQVQQLTGLSRSAIYRNMSEREFPTPVRLGPQTVAWVEAEVQSWIESRIQHARSTHTTQAPAFQWQPPGH